jgi:hypothetical protein
MPLLKHCIRHLTFLTSTRRAASSSLSLFCFQERRAKVRLLKKKMHTTSCSVPKLYCTTGRTLMSLICGDIANTSVIRPHNRGTCPPLLFQRVQLLVSTSCADGRELRHNPTESNSPFHAMILRGLTFCITESFKSYVHESENTIERMTTLVRGRGAQRTLH